jgi:starch synthase
LAGPTQLVVLGTGESVYEKQLQALAARHVGSMAVILAYNETLAHRIEAAADIFLMPSLFEPCGLNQMYSLRYGTLPVVREIGGLVDTVVDATGHNMEACTATGFVFQRPEPEELLKTVQRATDQWYDQANWRQMQQTAMSQDFSWQNSANRYLELYDSRAK